MPSSLSSSLIRSIALAALAVLALLVSFAAAPHRARAAALTLSTATTTSSNASTTLAKVGDTVSYRIVLSGTPWEAPKINILNMGTTTMSGSGTAYIYSTTTTSAWTNGAVPFYFSFGGTTAGDATTTKSQADITSGGNVRFDKTAPTVNSLASDAGSAGVLKVGDTIVFTMTPAAPEYGATMTGSYNGRSLTWSTANSGTTYTATYTVTEGDTDQASALQMTGAVITDAAGNAAGAAATLNVAKTIDANSPATPTAGTPAGSYSSSRSVTLSSTGSDSIRYTADGSTPSCSVGTVYSGAITVSATETVNAIGCDTAGNASSVASFAYVIESASRNRRNGGGGGRVYAIAGPVTATTPTVPVVPVTGTTVTGVTVTGGSAAPAFARNLQAGMSGTDVQALQKFLNGRGFMVALAGPGSAGNETTFFGALTKAAVAKFQAANGISPAVGFFGPITRAFVAGM